MSSDPDQTDPSLEDQLVAYLDGELDTQASLDIERLLSTDPQVRQTLQRLDRTWELLDTLDAPDVPNQLAQSTLEMVAVAAAEDAEKEETEAPRRRRRQGAVIAGSLVMAGLAGFLAVALLRPDPDAQLKLDLPVLENYDIYRQVDDIKILQLLEQEEVFGTTHGPGDVAIEEGGIESAEPRVGGTDSEELQRARERFENLEPAQQEDLHQLHDEIQNDAKSERLLHVAEHYTAWLATLAPYTRAELLELPPDERLDRIRALRNEEAENGLRRSDFNALIAWTKQYVEQHRDDVLQLIPDSRRERMADLNAAEQRSSLMWTVWLHRPRFGQSLPLGAEDMQQLKSKLSEEAWRQFDVATDDQMWETIGRWVRRALQHPLTSRDFRATLDAELQQRLDEFFEKELTPAQRDYLMSLSHDEMFRELRWMYFGRFGPDEGRRRPPGAGRGPRGPGQNPPPRPNGR